MNSVTLRVTCKPRTINHLLVEEQTKTQDNQRRSIVFMVATTIIFATQDGISYYLVGSCDFITIVAIQYMFLAIFGYAFSAHKSGGLIQAATIGQPWMKAGGGG